MTMPSRWRPSAPLALLAALAAAALAAGTLAAGTLAALGCGDAGAVAAATAGDRGLAVARGQLSRRLLLTGELAAAAGFEASVPRTPRWQVAIRWLAEDGGRVAAGDPLVELDTTPFLNDLEDREGAVLDADGRLDERRRALALEKREKELQRSQKQIELAKAEIEAAVPAELLGRADYEERQLALRRAELEVAKADEELGGFNLAAEAELAEMQLDLEAAERELVSTREAITALTIAAPHAGTVVVADHPWAGRKLQEGDEMWVGIPLVRLPDLTSLVVEAELSDVDDGALSIGMPVRCTLDAYPDETLAGRIVDLSAIAREEAGESLRRFFKVTIELDQVDPERMRPGMSVRVEALLGAPADSATAPPLLAPRAGLDLTAEPPRARMAAGGTREVELGRCDTLYCEVVAGLDEGAVLAAVRSE